MKYHSSQSYDLPYGSYTGGSNPLMGKRPASNLNVGSAPMKRMRTASRQRIVSPFGCDTVGNLPVPSKTDASSGDTSSFQDEQSSLNGGSAFQKGIEVDSSGNFEKQLPYDMAETSGKPKKKNVHQVCNMFQHIYLVWVSWKNIFMSSGIADNRQFSFVPGLCI